MIKCNKCERITPPRQPTGLIKEYREWYDANKTKRKDIVRVDTVCCNCTDTIDQ